ncbi:DUF2530 domain-containing protein [Mycolicibacterium palauense]|uniref:DUF2530 domain-containing protein n=1 Tax=Mycolicibacterium palauense TaxID=2034511 RepID=UPI000BFED75E|nr:DUF2530 domain-containing protein [Mycolicibacterium palauense]
MPADQHDATGGARDGSGSAGSPAAEPAAPPLPAALLEPWPVIAVGATIWLIATVLAFTVPELQTWRPVCLAGLATGVVGTSIVLWQFSAARRGIRGAQVGLSVRRDAG